MKIRILKIVDMIFGRFAIRLLGQPPVVQTSFLPLTSVLFIRPGGIGDAIHLIPAIRAIREKFPAAAIHILAERRNSAIFGLAGDFRTVICYDVPNEFFSVFKEKYDVVIDTEQWHRLSAVVARLIGAPLLIGFGSNERRRLLSYPVSYSHDDYEVVSFLRLLEPLGINSPSEFTLPWLTVPSNAAARADELLNAFNSERFVAIFPGASIPERRWGEKRFAAVACELEKHGFPIVVVGGKEDRASGELICGANGLNLAGKTSLAETAAVISHAKVLISGDSGVLHMAVALNVPTVSLFGPGIASKWAPRGNRHIVINRQLNCSPCTKFGNTKSCRVETRCMSDISIEEVTSSVMTIIQREKALSAELIT